MIPSIYSPATISFQVPCNAPVVLLTAVTHVHLGSALGTWTASFDHEKPDSLVSMFSACDSKVTGCQMHVHAP